MGHTEWRQCKKWNFLFPCAGGAYGFPQRMLFHPFQRTYEPPGWPTIHVKPSIHSCACLQFATSILIILNTSRTIHFYQNSLKIGFAIWPRIHVYHQRHGRVWIRTGGFFPIWLFLDCSCRLEIRLKTFSCIPTRTGVNA